MKKALIITALILGYLAVFGYKKYNDIREVIRQLQFRLKPGAGLKNVQFSGNSLVFDATVELVNPTSKGFNLNTGGLITIKRMEYYDPEGKLIAFSNTHIDKIAIEPESITELPPITTTLNVFQGITYAIDGMPEVAHTRAVIDIFGKTYTVET